MLSTPEVDYNYIAQDIETFTYKNVLLSTHTMFNNHEMQHKDNKTKYAKLENQRITSGK